MAWVVYGERKKTNDDDEGFDCHICGEWTEYDDRVTCSCCDNDFCVDCGPIECAGCKERDSNHCSICESCLAYPGCEACNAEDGDIAFCEECIKDHLTNCTKTSRLERAMNTESCSIMENEAQIRRLQEEITSKQSKLMHLESLVAGAKERKANAEDELRNKGGQPAKKLKTEG